MFNLKHRRLMDQLAEAVAKRDVAEIAELLEEYVPRRLNEADARLIFNARVILNVERYRNAT